jgi:hypothetical protein
MVILAFSFGAVFGAADFFSALLGMIVPLSMESKDSVNLP